MPDTLADYLTQRREAGAFLPPADVGRALAQIFPRADFLLPRPYKIFHADEQQPPIFGFPVLDSPALRDLDAKLERWLSDECAQVADRSHSRDKVTAAFSAYVAATLRLAENALLSNLMADYHGVFWLAHSFDVARQFSSVPRRISQLDSTLARTQGDAIKYKLFAKWSAEVLDGMQKLAVRHAPTLEGEQERAVAFFKTINENVLFLTEEFIGPDLRELRSFVTGFLRADFSLFKETFERYRNLVDDLARRDRTLRNTIELFGASAEHGVTVSLLTDRRFQKFLFEHPAIEAQVNREDRERIISVSRRLTEFGVLHALRRSIVWLSVTEDGEVIPSDRKGGSFSRSTRPIDYGRQGVIDPMVYRFGLMYDISSFSETLGNIARSGRKGEMASYRQMLLFQRRMDSIAGRNRLQFEKFLGDGAFYTTRRALRLIRAAIEIQRVYFEMKQRGFAFNRGLRIALNYGYYRLLPMKGLSDASEKVTEFYGPGVVELSRLTTGKATKEIEEIQGFLIAHGYEAGKVQTFFAPLARGVDVVDHKMHEREFYAYVNASGHLVNEGIVGSLELMQELSNELVAEGQKLYRLSCEWGTYIGFNPSQEGFEYVGLRIIGNVSLKGLQNIDVAEIVAFPPGAATVTETAQEGEPLLALLRHDYTQRSTTSSANPESLAARTAEQRISGEIVISTREESLTPTLVFGEWNPATDEISHTIEVEWEELQLSVSLRTPLSADILESRKESLRRFYQRRCKLSIDLATDLPTVPRDRDAATYILGERVERI
jgi:hypothetical protein